MTSRAPWTWRRGTAEGCGRLSAIPRTLALILVLALAGCFRLLPSEGGGQAYFESPRQVDPSDVALPAGYGIEVVASGLTFPSGIAFDEKGGIYLTEAGYSYGDVVTVPRLLHLAGGEVREVARGTNPPWTGVAYHEGAFFVAGGHLEPGRILRISPDGEIRTLVDGLPSLGDHHTNGPAVSDDGWVYFGQGTATNSGVVGLDNFDFGWPRRYPRFHDVPCRRVVLAGRNYVTSNPLTAEEDDQAVTGPFLPFGVPAREGQVVEGSSRCGGAVMRVRAEGGEPELVAWGLRNPFGLAFSPRGELFVTENQYDVRGSRPIFGTGDLLWRIEPGAWYGWPDFWGGLPVTEEAFASPGASPPRFVLEEHPGTPPLPAARLGVHGSANGLDFSRSDAFGYRGEAFIAEFGDMAPATGKVMAPVGFKVIRVDARTGVVHDFAINRGAVNGPASWLDNGGLERPIAVRFDPSGEALYVVDFGVMTTRDGVPRPQPGTGVLWRIVKRP